MDREVRKKRLERFSRSEQIFPGGEHETGNCTACARIITRRFGGEVRGYYHADNPTARVGETQYGHDFAVTKDRFLVDPWLYHYYGESPVLDMDAPADRAEATARYGGEENWKLMPDWQATVEPQARQIRR
jgi:hypothetical protein